ncbi:unnamed protein product [Lepeophtheirus salmonis]|uniref:(salmon louse) hypothetical protein n=1 Tax=Lepeophtheirus salmonis TaxID=72036 RepID=A0A7R8HAQ2_LEPSM|nr:unnamed protein product [Lepeophtheirus salmonis]CAF2973980.1 unnamed protein product [Lepeophtheirus salmonis]
MKFNLFSLVIFGILRLSRCQNQFILGFNKKSCDTLEPMYVLEDYTHIKLGPNNEEKSVEIKIDFDQYRRNREYKIRLEASRFFDGYMLQVQGKRDGNRTYVGSWKSAKNKVPRLISCNGIKNAGLISKKRPVQYGNQTFYWRAPSSNAGPLRIFVSIIFQDAYFILNSKEITFNAYPLSLKGCGKSMSCFRYCKMEPFCDADETEYMLTISEDPKNPESVMFKLGGKVNGPENYIALGFGYDMTNIKDMDIVACYNENNAIKLGHYLLENQDSNPQIHRSKIQLELSDYDEETGYIWCQFSRPINPQSVNATEILLPPMNQVFSSPLSLNISDQVNEVRFNGGKSSGQTLLNPEFLLYFVTIFLSFIGI